MNYIEPSELANVKQIDLLTYLHQCEPDELVKLGADIYTTKTHDSLKLSNNKWYWWSQGFGGRSALDYLIKVKGFSFLEAAHKLGAEELETPKQHIPLAQPKKTFSCRCRHKQMIWQSAISNSEVSTLTSSVPVSKPE